MRRPTRRAAGRAVGVEPVEDQERDEGHRNGSHKLETGAEPARRRGRASELAHELLACRLDDLRDDRHPKGAEEQQAGNEYECDVDKLAAHVGPACFARPDRPEGRASRAHHPARPIHEQEQRDETDQRG